MHQPPATRQCRLFVRVTPAERDRLRTAAQAQGRTVSEYVRRALSVVAEDES